jgi:hypothetical protein
MIGRASATTTIRRYNEQQRGGEIATGFVVQDHRRPDHI